MILIPHYNNNPVYLLQCMMANHTVQYTTAALLADNKDDIRSRVPLGLSTFLTAISVLTTLTNICVLILLLKTRSLHKQAHVVLVLFLCISDINVGLSGVIYGVTFISPVLSTNRDFCSFHVVIFIIGVGQSLSQSFLICLNRFAATTSNSIVSNMFKRKRKYVFIFSVWIGVQIYVIPTIAIHQETIEYCSVACLLGYNYRIMAIIISSYAVPLLVMIVIVYIVTVLRVYKRFTTVHPNIAKENLSTTTDHVTNEVNEKKVRKTIMTVGILLLFMLIFTAPIVFCLFLESFGIAVHRLVRTTLCILTIFNSLFNPIIYACRLQEFRNAVKLLFKTNLNASY